MNHADIAPLAYSNCGRSLDHRRAQCVRAAPIGWSKSSDHREMINTIDAIDNILKSYNQQKIQSRMR